MPIGTSKAGLLGAGIVPGGSETFNACGTFIAPPGVNTVNITGYGGAGSSGGAGNPGGIGPGGAGAIGGLITAPVPNTAGGRTIINTPGGSGAISSGPGNTGTTGNTGAASTVFCLNLCGGAGGLGGGGGAQGGAGNIGGSAPTTPLNTPTGPPGGTGGSNGAPGGVNGGQGVSGTVFAQLDFKCPCGNFVYAFSGGGGGGAGTVNNGQAATQNVPCTSPGFVKPAALGGTCYGGAGGRGSKMICEGGSIVSNGPGSAGGTASGPGAGGGGGAGYLFVCNVFSKGAAGGGGGGARGDAGSTGNAGSSGNAANPTTHNCVSIVGGSSYPVTVNGQVNISWCPQ